MGLEEEQSKILGQGKMPPLPEIKTVVETDEEAEARMAKEWADDGRRGRVIIRRKEFPQKEFSPQKVCQIIFSSLQVNDDPILDYGAAVVVKFASEKNAVRGMSPEGYGNFLRADDDYALLVENSRFGLLGNPKVSSDATQALQRVQVIGPPTEYMKREVEAQLSRASEEDPWMVDAITFVA
ncbi:unnamed protein product [Discosporangium mesarthrocarpum]